VTAYVIVPGIDGSDDQHWQTWWEREWGGSAVRISPSSWSAPRLDDWIAAVQRAYDAAAQQDAHVVVVAHSLGCWAVSEWLADSPSTPVRAALLVAPPDPAGPNFPRDAAPSFTAVTTHPLPCPASVVASVDDPYCTADAAAIFAGGWRARWHLLGAYGHINSDSGLGSWHQGRELLAELLK
jgi:predicted alpha/beta hydrolase family esterase